MQNIGALFGYEREADVCVPGFCLDAEMARDECGFEGAQCGSLCPKEPESCPGMECGTDPDTGEVCGSCPEGTVCNLENKCSQIVVQCSSATCRDGADVALSRDLAVGEYEIEISNGIETELCTLEVDQLSHFAVCTEVFSVRLQPSRVFVDGAHKKLSVRISDGESILADEDLDLEYSAFRPNGEGCLPECQVAFAEVVLN